MNETGLGRSLLNIFISIYFLIYLYIHIQAHLFYLATCHAPYFLQNVGVMSNRLYLRKKKCKCKMQILNFRQYVLFLLVPVLCWLAHVSTTLSGTWLYHPRFRLNQPFPAIFSSSPCLKSHRRRFLIFKPFWQLPTFNNCIPLHCLIVTLL